MYESSNNEKSEGYAGLSLVKEISVQAQASSDSDE